MLDPRLFRAPRFHQYRVLTDAKKGAPIVAEDGTRYVLRPNGALVRTSPRRFAGRDHTRNKSAIRRLRKKGSHQ